MLNEICFLATFSDYGERPINAFQHTVDHIIKYIKIHMKMTQTTKRSVSDHSQAR